MSEHEHEQHEDFTAPDPREAPEGVDPETGEIHEQTIEQAATEESSEEMIKKAERARGDFTRRIQKIMGENAPTHDCPTCQGLGLVWDLPADPVELVEAADAVACEDCNGLGVQRLPSRVPGNDTRTCLTCGGRGWHEVVAAPTNVTPLAPSTATSGGTTMGWQDSAGVFHPLITPNPAQGSGAV